MNLNDAVKAERELTRAIASGQPEEIARTATANIWPLFSSHFELLRSAVESLPPSVLERRPILRVMHPLTPVLARASRPYKPLVPPEEARTMSPDELDALTLVQMVAFRFSGDVAAAQIYARRLEDRIRQVHADSRERTDGPLWYFHYQIASPLLTAGESSRALLELGTARQLGQLSLQPDAERITLARTALAHAVRGSLDDADRALAEAAQHPPATAAHRSSNEATERTAAALIAADRVSDDVDRILMQLEPYDSIEMSWPFALLARTRALLSHHRPDEALEAIHLARDAHPLQHGAFATDVITSASIEALWGVGDVSAARREAEAQSKGGTLTLFAIARLAIYDGRLEVAARGLRRLERDENLGPGHRAKLQLLSAWLEMARSNALDSTTARQIRRLAVREDNRRLLATMPAQLVELVRTSLPPDEVSSFDEAMTGLSHTEIVQRPELTGGELRVLKALSVHTTTAAIASRFHVSPNTIKSQLKSIYRKLGCSTREGALTTATRFHLIDPD